MRINIDTFVHIEKVHGIKDVIDPCVPTMFIGQRRIETKNWAYFYKFLPTIRMILRIRSSHLLIAFLSYAIYFPRNASSRSPDYILLQRSNISALSV